MVDNDGSLADSCEQAETKKCNECQVVKGIERFGIKVKRTYKRFGKCRDCQNKKYRERYAAGLTKKNKGRNWSAVFGSKHGEKPCRKCGKNIWGEKTAEGKSSRICSECRKLTIKVVKPHESQKAKRFLRIISFTTRCLECGKLAISSRRPKKFCCLLCGYRDKRRTRRARNRAAFVEEVSLFAIADRDKWICQLCGKKVQRVSSFKRQATIDHVIPISKGGLHEYANCQLAHFDCNSKKHDRVDSLF